MTLDEAERQCREALDALRQEYEVRARPFIDQLVRIQNLRPPPPIYIPIEVAQRLGFMSPGAPTREQCIEWVKYAIDTTGYVHKEAVRAAIIAALSKVKAKSGECPTCGGHGIIRHEGSLDVVDECPACQDARPEGAP